MPANDVTITLTGRDNVSQTFRTVGRSAQDMGKSLADVEKTSSKMGETFSRTGAVAGAAFAALSGSLSTFANAAAESEASQARLDTAIENTGHTTLEYADQLNAASKAAVQLGFDDEDAADAIAKMTTATGDANKAITDLSIAEDIARARKISLADASNIVIAAEQGRVGALQRMGIQLDASASQEARLDALRKQFAGNAEAYAATTAGAVDRASVRIENLQEALGAQLGRLQPLLAMLPELSAGYTLIGASVGGLSPVFAAAEEAAAGFGIALGPVGVGAAAIAAGAGLVGLIAHLGAFEDASDAAQGSAESLAEKIALMAAGGQDVSQITAVSDTWNRVAAQSADDVTNYLDVIDQLSNAQLYGLTPQQISNLEQTRDALEKTMLTSDQIKTVTKDIETLFSMPGVDTKALSRDLNYYFAQLQAGKTTGDEFVGWIESTTKHWYDYSIAAHGARVSTDEVTTAIRAQISEAKNLGDQYTNLDGGLKQYLDTQERTNDLQAAGTRSTKVLGDQFENLDGDSLNPLNSTLAETTKAQNDAAAASKAATAAFLDEAAGVGFLDSELDKLIAAGVSTWAERTASRVLGATDALDAMYGVVVGGTQHIAQQSDQLNTWALDLINVQGTYGKIDDLLAAGVITLDEYNDAQTAQARIAADNNRIQQDTLVIQAKQAPVLADVTDKEAKYYDQLAKMPAQQQLVALGWMDQNEAAKANAALNLAAAAAAGTYGDAGEAAATKAITAQAQADPAFAAMLSDMGLISEGADGTIKVNFPDSETIQEAVDGLSDSVDALTLALGGVPPGVTTNVTVTGVDSATSAVTGYSYLLDTINGKQVITSVYVDAYGPGIGYTNLATGGMIPAEQTAPPSIPHAQHGASLGGWAWVGEAGPELIHAPGARVLPHTASVAREGAPGGGSPTFHFHAPLTIVTDNPRTFADQMTAYAYGAQR